MIQLHLEDIPPSLCFRVVYDDFKKEELRPLHPNQVVIANESLPLLVVKKKSLPEKGEIAITFLKISLDQKRNIEPKDLNQKIFLYYLEDHQIPLVTCLAPSGCGKTFLSVYYALKALKEKEYNRVIVIKPLLSVTNSKFLGTLPGDVDEKIAPFVESFYDVADSLNMTQVFESFMEKGFISFQPLDFMRGRNLAKTLVIMDEVQNLNKHSLLTIGTRIAEGSKLILLGDPKQKDMMTDLNIQEFVEHDFYTSSPYSAFVELKLRCRSPITALFESIL